MIASVVTFATGQGTHEQEGFSDHFFWLYFLIVHLLAWYGFISLVLNIVKWMKPKKELTLSISEMDEAEEDRRLRTTSSFERTKVVQNRTPEDEGLRSRSSAAANEPAARSSTAASESAADGFVCIIGQGEKYHRPSCGMVCAAVNRHRVRNMLRGAAVNAGYIACKQCRPR